MVCNQWIMCLQQRSQKIKDLNWPWDDINYNNLSPRLAPSSDSTISYTGLLLNITLPIPTHAHSYSQSQSSSISSLIMHILTWIIPIHCGIWYILQHIVWCHDMCMHAWSHLSEHLQEAPGMCSPPVRTLQSSYNIQVDKILTVT